MGSIKLSINISHLFSTRLFAALYLFPKCFLCIFSSPKLISSSCEAASITDIICIFFSACGNALATLSSIRHRIRKNMDRPGLFMAAICRASAILHSQKPMMVKRNQACLTKSS
uniref:Uncharacterized protein n=1 Tax=Lynx canadensis TaxID=61383 RepID=A0A667GVQ9_LYNCA